MHQWGSFLQKETKITKAMRKGQSAKRKGAGGKAKTLNFNHE
jgi:hypothetical protein